MRSAASRGATLVEYALIASMFLTGSLVVFEFMNDAAEGEVANQSVCVSTRPPPAECLLSPVTTTTTLVPTPTTATTVPDPPAPVPTAERASAMGGSSAGQPWYVTQLVRVTEDSGGEIPMPIPVSGVNVRARVRLVAPGSETLPYTFVPGEFFVACVTDINGECEMRFDVPYEDVTRLWFEFTNVDSNPPGNLPNPVGNYAQRPT